MHEFIEFVDEANLQRRSSLRAANHSRKPPCGLHLAPALPRPPHPTAQFVTTRDPPLVSGAMPGNIRRFLFREKRNIFDAES
ncbi:MAG: hypothetical protein HY852_16810 [Bradyrhizobium sp.]|uniref:hypothetical protein n=1 Tax=Bradyrhizobium sp. TaxID=376 RepID=UPI0025BAECD2|nr:hypothetical protein [Bradyrhizobium sp.]MBI5263473.1 hypothetical protein [Bradyrhizobium sp.]